jgi:Uma2 family endonuclease
VTAESGDIYHSYPGFDTVFTEWGLQSAPDLVIEIVSPESGRKDRREKFRLYERYGVGEYWILDPDEKVVEIYARQHDCLERTGAYGSDDRPGVTALPGFECDLSRVFLR